MLGFVHQTATGRFAAITEGVDWWLYFPFPLAFLLSGVTGLAAFRASEIRVGRMAPGFSCGTAALIGVVLLFA